MVEITYENSPYRFTDPVRLFKANDPYYFEVDNIPIKQLQENCLWLKDQIRTLSQPTLSQVKRADIDELRPYANGGDRVIRVRPGRYTARINDASSRRPLAYLKKVMGEAIADVDAWEAALPNAGTFNEDLNLNEALEAALDTFKTITSQNAMGMNGLSERAFTWPVVNSDYPVNDTGAISTSETDLSYAGPTSNQTGGSSQYSPFVITQALLWAKSKEAGESSVLLTTFETTDTINGWSKLPRTESYFIKAWRGVARLAIVDVEEEIQIEVPQFDSKDFSYTTDSGDTTPVQGVKQRIDLVFIYSKPIDMSGVNILNKNGKQTITKPTLGIVKGAGIKVNYSESSEVGKDYIVPTNDSILASPADQYNENMGFNSTSANDIFFDIRGSFPAPDDILNLAPLISEKLENTAYELVGQSILPIAYVFVEEDSQLILPSDVIDIRPFFRTAELAYNERAGIAAAFPQLSLANPAVGKAQLDLEVKTLKDSLVGSINTLEDNLDQAKRRPTVAAMGYIFGGWNFGPESVLYDYFSTNFGAIGPDASVEDVKDYITKNYGYASIGSNLAIPNKPDWDLARWCTQEDLENKGDYPNDYINTFFGSVDGNNPLTAGSYKDSVTDQGSKVEGGAPSRINKVINDDPATTNNNQKNFIFHFVSKRINFRRPSWLVDYKVDVDFVNCLPRSSVGNTQFPANYFGHWVEKSDDSFTIYVAFYAPMTENSFSRYDMPHPGPYFATNYREVKKKKSNNLKKKKTLVPNGTTEVIQRDGARFSSFLVPVQAILYPGTDDPIGENPENTREFGYLGNPRAGLCTYPTVMWSVTALPQAASQFLYASLNSPNPIIDLKED